MVEKDKLTQENSEDIATFKGVLHFFSETGTEGGSWAFQDERFITPPTKSHPDEQWSYDGLHVLKDGDELTIYDKKHPKKVVWQGTISLTPFTVFKDDAFGMWIHNDQIGIDRETWAKFFMNENPAKLIIKPEVKTK